MRREKSWAESGRDFDPVIRSSVLLLLRFKKVLSTQILMTVRQFVMVGRMSGLMDLVEMYSCVPSA